MRFRCAQLGPEHRASSYETPQPVSRKHKRGGASRGGNSGADKEALIEAVVSLNASIADMSRANVEMSRASKVRRIDNLREQCYRVSLQQATATSDAEKHVHQVYLNQLLRQIETAEEEIDGTSS